MHCHLTAYIEQSTYSVCTYLAFPVKRTLTPHTKDMPQGGCCWLSRFQSYGSYVHADWRKNKESGMRIRSFARPTSLREVSATEPDRVPPRDDTTTMPGTHLDDAMTQAQPVKPVLASSDVSPPLKPISKVSGSNTKSSSEEHQGQQPQDKSTKESQLKQFVEDDRHFNLVRCVLCCY